MSLVVDCVASCIPTPVDNGIAVVPSIAAVAPASASTVAAYAWNTDDEATPAGVGAAAELDERGR